jgi:hypothetical protein
MGTFHRQGDRWAVRGELRSVAVPFELAKFVSQFFQVWRWRHRNGLLGFHALAIEVEGVKNPLDLLGLSGLFVGIIRNFSEHGRVL